MNSNVIRIMPVHQRVESQRYPSCFSIQESLDSPPRSTERGYITCSLRPCDGSDSSSALLSASLDHCARRSTADPSDSLSALLSQAEAQDPRSGHSKQGTRVTNGAGLRDLSTNNLAIDTNMTLNKRRIRPVVLEIHRIFNAQHTLQPSHPRPART
ncbi:hypothetical protein K523DRAFT_158200 [Schizophyllum commune Tattone D]|nr:hypothetical protein K523DRAFT_158200 [Schizophyllum commune Tattone D]